VLDDDKTIKPEARKNKNSMVEIDDEETPETELVEL